jgi:glycosyltransferase involved in cell wall biosynthesis
MKQILILIKGLGRGGAEQLLVSAARHLDTSKFGYRVAYLLPWKDGLVGDLNDAGIETHCLDGARGPGWIRRLRRLVVDEKIDLVHSHSPYAAIGARLALTGPQSPKQIYTEHNLWSRYHPATYWANLLTFPRSDHVFAVSQHVLESIRYPGPLGWMPSPPRETLYHGIDPATVVKWASPDGVRTEFGIDPDDPIIGTVANFKSHKGHQYLLKAALIVRESFPTVRFLLVGQGPTEDEVRSWARQLDLEGTVIFTGDRADVPRIASEFDVFALPSVHEGLSIALIEAMALGKPAVVTSVGGLPEVLQHERQGLLVPPRDPKALAEAIVSLLDDRTTRSRFGEAASRRALDFDIRRAVSRMEQVYEEVLS